MAKVSRAKDGVQDGPNFLSKKLWSKLRFLSRTERRDVFQQAAEHKLKPVFEKVYKPHGSDSRKIAVQTYEVKDQRFALVVRQRLEGELAVNDELYTDVWHAVQRVARDHRVQLAEYLARFDDTVFVEHIPGANLGEALEGVTMSGDERVKLYFWIKRQCSSFTQAASEAAKAVIISQGGRINTILGDSVYASFPGSKHDMLFFMDVNAYNFIVRDSLLTDVQAKMATLGPKAYVTSVLHDGLTLVDPFVLVWKPRGK